MIAQTPDPPYYAVIFTSIRTDQSKNEYAEASKRMMDLAAKQKGFLGVESARNELGITVSYWSDPNAIKAWKNQAEHQSVQEKGRELWYRNFKVRIAKVDRDYGMQ